ncbi:MAG: DUF1080 domain-containing protein [Puniceicoccales bacterium]|jgi:hypothetical protein|nr:DUF1080 domain-containing protein [Puniceicoccales bacterium]
MKTVFPRISLLSLLSLSTLLWGQAAATGNAAENAAGDAAAGGTGAVVSADTAAGWRPLFDGKTLNGWVERGLNGVFSVEDGVIVGTTKIGRENTFLCTVRDYADFELELEYKVPERMNSGVQIRSAFNPSKKPLPLLGVPPLPVSAADAAKGKGAGKGARKDGKVFASPNHVYGYQVEIEFRPGRTAGIYDEARRRGWVFPTTGTEQDAAFIKQGRDRSLFKPGEWQKLRVVCQGDRLRTWLDGVPRADVRDAASATGFIALQVHSAPPRDAGLQARFRNIRLRPLPPVAPPATPEETAAGDAAAHSAAR